MKPLVSVIVPVYNVEGYLEQCVDSLTKQTLQDIEIILVDDGSTDRSGNMCDTYAQEDQRILVIHKDNGGVSSARNAGIEAARSDYIIFVDSDDWVEPDFCKTPYSIAVANRCDIILSNHNAVWNGIPIRLGNRRIQEGLVSREIAMDLIHGAGPGLYSWNMFCHKDLWKDTRFPLGRLSEDVGITYKLVHNARRIYYCKHRPYNHRIGRPGSLTSSQSMKFVVDYIDMRRIKDVDLENWGYGGHFKKKDALDSLIHYGNIKRLTNCFVPVIEGIKGYPDYLTPRERLMLFAYRRSVLLFDVICIVTGGRKKVKGARAVER